MHWKDPKTHQKDMNLVSKKIREVQELIEEIRKLTQSDDSIKTHRYSYDVKRHENIRALDIKNLDNSISRLISLFPLSLSVSIFSKILCEFTLSERLIYTYDPEEYLQKGKVVKEKGRQIKNELLNNFEGEIAQKFIRHESNIGERYVSLLKKNALNPYYDVLHILQLISDKAKETYSVQKRHALEKADEAWQEDLNREYFNDNSCACGESPCMCSDPQNNWD